jgi:methionine transaminase
VISAPALRSKLPDVGTTIFTVISRRANEVGALNIGQGFPDFPMDPLLIERVAEAMREGRNQYAHGDGVPELRQQIAAKIQRAYGVAVDPAAQITLTCGGTEALFSAIQAVVQPGDEVILFDPAYDAYEPAVRLAGGRCIRLPLLPPSFAIDWDRFRAALTPRTRLVVLNNPHNPAGVVHGADVLDRLADVLDEREVFVVADEVYEHCVFDGRRHATVLAHPRLAARSFAVFSFGKTLHATGWRSGYCVAPPELTREFRKVHQFNTFSIATPIQWGVARYLAEKPESWLELPAFFQAKRDRLRGLLEGSGFSMQPSQGTYFQLLDFSELSKLPDVEFVDDLIRDGGVAPIPLSPFYRERPRLSLLRVCIAKQDETLDLAARKLRAYAERCAGAARAAS